jgi:hypothetical protein
MCLTFKGYSKIMTIADLKLRISEKFRTKKEEWPKSPGRHGTEEIPLLTKEVLSRRFAECSRPHRGSMEIRRLP